MKRLTRRALARAFLLAWSVVQLEGAALIVAGMWADRLTQLDHPC